MKCDFSVEDAVTKPYSVRTFDKGAVEKETKEKLLSYAEQLNNPLGPRMKVQFIEKATASNGEKLRTYGVIKDAQSYLAAVERNLSGHFERKCPNIIVPHDVSYVASWIIE